MADKNLADLLHHGLRDIFYAEQRIYKSLPKMISAASDSELANALSKHRDETGQHIEMVKQCFEALGQPAKAETCDAMDGILKEADSLLADFGGTAAGDAAIIFSAQAVEHYEIARYGSLRTYAEELGLEDVAETLDTILSQEVAADEILTEIAEGGVNEDAEA